MSNSTTMERVFITDWIMETAQKIDTMIFGVRFSTLAKLAIDEAKAQKRKSRQNNYSTVINSFMEFRGGRDIRKKEIGNPLLHEFRKYLETKGLKESTIVCYLKNLKAILNKKYGSPCHSEETEIMPAPNRRDSKVMALDKEDLDKVLQYQPKENSKEEFAYDVFMLQLSSMGMPFVDVANLKKSDIDDKYINYCRHKTNMPVCVPINQKITEIVNKYSNMSTNEYLFPIIKEGDDFDIEYRRMLDSVNYQLRKIGKKLGLSHPLSTYTARHTWAAIAYDRGVNINVIAMCLGHANTTYTKAYIENMQRPREKSANSIVLTEIFGVAV